MRERSKAKRGSLLTVTMVTGLALTAAIFLPVAGAGETTPPPPPSALGTELLLLAKFEPWMVMSMVLGVLAALIISLWMIYQYIARVRTTELHRQLLMEAVTDFQYRKRRPPRFEGRTTPVREDLVLLSDRKRQRKGR